MSNDSAGRDEALEECARLLESGRYTVLQPHRTHTAQELSDAIRNHDKEMAKKIRRLKDKPALSRQAAQGVEAVATWQRNDDQSISFEVVGDPYVVNGAILYSAPPDTAPRAELDAVNDELVEAQEKAFGLEGQIELMRKELERSENLRKLAQTSSNEYRDLLQKAVSRAEGAETALVLALKTMGYDK